MKKLILISLTIASVANAAWAEDQSISAQIVTPAGQEESLIAIVQEYSNITNFLGPAFVNGGAALQGMNTITRLVADDITPTGTNAGQDVTGIVFSVANLNGTAVTARPRLRFWFSDGAGGGPGTYYNVPADVGFTVNAISILTGVTLFSVPIPAGIFTMPGTKFWAGMTFDDNNGATGITAAELNNLGQGAFDPPTVGSSADQHFVTTAAGSFFPTDNPAGALGNLSGDPVASYGWQFEVEAIPTATPTVTPTATPTDTPDFREVAPTVSTPNLFVLALILGILGGVTMMGAQRRQ